MEKIEYEQLSRTDIFRWLDLDYGDSMEEQKETAVTHTGWLWLKFAVLLYWQ